MTVVKYSTEAPFGVIVRWEGSGAGYLSEVPDGLSRSALRHILGLSTILHIYFRL